MEICVVRIEFNGLQAVLSWLVRGWTLSCLKTRYSPSLNYLFIFVSLDTIITHGQPLHLKNMLSAELLPTQQMYAELQAAHDFFNEELFVRVFSQELPPCLITLQRKHNTMGYFSPGRFTNLRGVKVDEIALHPGFFPMQTISEIMQTIVHEQCHQYQHHYGTPGRSRYHNKELAEIAKSVGLIFSSTGRPGGKSTGDSMNDYVQEGGYFEAACAKLVTQQFVLSWLDRFPISVEDMATSMHQLPEEIVVSRSDAELQELGITVVDHNVKKKKSTVGYSCPLCTRKVWGKPGLEIGCLPCNEPMRMEEN